MMTLSNQASSHIIGSSADHCQRSCDELGLCQQRAQPCAGCHWMRDHAVHLDEMITRCALAASPAKPPRFAPGVIERGAAPKAKPWLMYALAFASLAALTFVLAFSSGAIGRLHGWW